MRATGDERLFLLTPDAAAPAAVAQVNDPRVVWFPFKGLSDAIDTVVTDQREAVSEQTRYLLRELQALFIEDGLLARREVVIVAARTAYPEYLEYRAYVCQPDRTFADAERMAFYATGAIKPEGPKMRYVVPQVPFTGEEAARRMASDNQLDWAAGTVIGR